ncbi:MAG: hypothetical protein LIO94_08445, partial [Clostridiales bacterium]|nr:hypothetical protein [Clostridiales bacterium]
MKKRYAKQAGGILLAALIGASGAMSAGTLAFAEEETEAVSESVDAETVDDAGTEADAAEESAEIEVTELEISLDGETVTVANATGIVMESVTVGAESAEDTAEDTVLTFTAEDGTVHTFELTDAAGLTALSNLTLTEKIGFFFLSGTDTNGDTSYYYETADEITLEDSVTMYT